VNRSRSIEIASVVALIVFGSAARLAPEVIPSLYVPNFAPVAAIALFAGYVVGNRLLAAAAPLGVMVVSDWFLGGYEPIIMAVVYASLAAPVLAGHWLKGHMALSTGGTFGTLTGLSLAASCLFFVTTNLACWAFSPWYAPTWAGLVECFGYALPFFRYTLAGDLFFALSLFGGYFALASAWNAEPKQEQVATDL